MKQSAGVLVYRRVNERLEVLLVHPSGNYNRRAPWGIPKGLPDEGESFEEAAIRETWEETGVRVAASELIPLGHIDYTRSRKRVMAYAAALPADATPKPSCWEVDRAEFLPIEKARKMIHPDQEPFLDRLLTHLDMRGADV